MKIDFVIGSLRAGGAERVVTVLANYFAQNQHQVRIITFFSGDQYDLHPAVQRLKFHKDIVIFNYVTIKGFLKLLAFYRKKSNRPDVISSHINMVGYATILPAKLYGIKIVISEHFNHSTKKLTLPIWFLRNYLYPLADHLTVLTSYDESYFKRKNKNTSVMYNPSSFKPALDKEYKTREKIILAIGNVNRFVHKGFDNLIEIAKKILPSFPDWKLLIIGQGDEGIKFLKKQIDGTPVEEQIEFTGFRSDIEQIMAMSEVFILSSRHEGLPMVLIEAVSQGMACISYDCVSGPSEIIESGKNGILVKDQNHDEMAQQLTKLLNDGELRKKLRINTNENIEKFSIDTIGGQWTKLFNSLVNKA